MTHVLKRTVVAAALVAASSVWTPAQALGVLAGISIDGTLTLQRADGVDTATYEDLGTVDSSLVPTTIGAWSGSSFVVAGTSGTGALIDLLGVSDGIRTGLAEDTFANASPEPGEQRRRIERSSVNLFVIRNTDAAALSLDFLFEDGSEIVRTLEPEPGKRIGFDGVASGRVESVTAAGDVLALLAQTTLGPLSGEALPGDPTTPLTTSGPAPARTFTVGVDPLSELRLRITYESRIEAFSVPIAPSVPLAPAGVLLLTAAAALCAAGRRRA